MEISLQSASPFAAEAVEAHGKSNNECVANDTKCDVNVEMQAERTCPSAPHARTSPTTARSTAVVIDALATPPVEMRAEAMIPVAGEAAPQFPVLHPHGFRILNNSSAMERNMRGYFRLPQPPNAVAKEKRRRLRRTLRQVESEEAQRRACVAGCREGVLLDGFLILGACEADDPEEVTAVTLQASQLTSSVTEDLPYFTELRMLDVSDNQLRLGDVLPCPNLETVHLVCNGITSLSDVRDSDSPSLSTLLALDLAYNRIPSRDLLYLGAFRSLQELDLSNNGLRSLPADLSSLSHLTHLALESNQLVSANTFHALGTLPALVAVNLARNRLSRVPLLNVTLLPGVGDAGHSHANAGAESDHVVAFPALQTITLTENRFASVDAFLPLAALHRTLRHIAVGGNPFLVRQPQKSALQLQHSLHKAVVDLYFIAKDPAPPPPPFSSTNMTASLTDAYADTWQGKTWVRYIPPPSSFQNEEEEVNDEGGHLCSRASPLDTAAPVPLSAPEGKGMEAAAQHADATSIAPDKSQDSARSPSRDLDDDVYRLSVEAYVERYHINVQCATQQPPPAKQPKRFFYSAAFRATESAAQSGSPLVTLPPYEEFMDIYRIVGRQSHLSRWKGHPAVLRRGRGMCTSVPASRHQVTLPVIERNDSTSPTPAVPSVALQGRKSISCHIEEQYKNDDDEEEDKEGFAENEAQAADDGFFLTGISNEVKKEMGDNRKKRGAMRSATKKSVLLEESPVEVEGFGQFTTQVPVTHTNSQNHTFYGNQSCLPDLPLPRSVVSPANTNVHTAMSELRALLRKPLPSLPYEPTRSRQGH